MECSLGGFKCSPLQLGLRSRMIPHKDAPRAGDRRGGTPPYRRQLVLSGSKSQGLAGLTGMTERLPFPDVCPMIEVGRVRTVLGCRNPDRQVSAAGRSELLPRPFGVGEPVAYVQAPKAKGHRSLSIGFRTPRPRVTRAVCGGAPQTFFPSTWLRSYY